MQNQVLASLGLAVLVSLAMSCASGDSDSGDPNGTGGRWSTPEPPALRVVAAVRHRSEPAVRHRGNRRCRCDGQRWCRPDGQRR